MHFQVIKDDYYNNIFNELRSRVPEFQSIFDEDDGIYLVLGEFGRFINSNIENTLILKKSFEFINHSLEVGGNETEEAIIIQIFQPIYDNKLIVEKIRPYLKGKGLSIFDEYKNKWDVK